MLNHNEYADNPILVRVTRAGRVESVHRGAWCLVDRGGHVLEGAGDLEHPYFVRSAIKVIQALPLLDSGAAQRFGFGAPELAMAIASHSGEPCHTDTVREMLGRLALDERALLCGTHPPNDPRTRLRLRESGASPSTLHNNCSGKHAGFLALARQLEVPVERYLEPDSLGQLQVRRALCELTGVSDEQLAKGIDGCSAPTFALPLPALGMAFARVTNPGDLESERRAHCVRLTNAAHAYPVHIAGSYKRIDTDIMRATGGRLFPKIGAEAVHVIGVHGSGQALAVKVDDGGLRGLHALVLALLERLSLASEDELQALEGWRDPVLRNHAGLDVGRIEVLV